MAEAKTISIQVTKDQQLAIMAALELQQKSYERAARSNELMNKPNVAAAIREELRQLVNIKTIVDQAK